MNIGWSLSKPDIVNIVEAVDFNYMYMSFTSMPIAEDIIIGNDQYSARARFVKRINGIYLYEIVNAHEMYLD